MDRKLTRRDFSIASLSVAAGALIASPSQIMGAPPKRGAQGSSGKNLPPVNIQYVPGVYQDRYADLGGVLDTTTGVIWGYEPDPAISTGNTSWRTDSQVNQSYLNLLSAHTTGGTAEENAKFVAAYNVAVQRFWRRPTVTEARDAVAKGLFTFGEGGCNLYYASPINTQPGVSYGLFNLRWTSTEVNSKSGYAWSAGDGGAAVVSKTSSLFAIVVSRLV